MNVYSETIKSFDQHEYYIKLRVIGFINAAPCFKFSPFPLVPSQSVVVSIPTIWNMSRSTLFHSFLALLFFLYFISLASGLPSHSNDSIDDFLDGAKRRSEHRGETQAFFRHFQAILFASRIERLRLWRWCVRNGYSEIGMCNLEFSFGFVWSLGFAICFLFYDCDRHDCVILLTR